MALDSELADVEATAHAVNSQVVAVALVAVCLGPEEASGVLAATVKVLVGMEARAAVVVRELPVEVEEGVMVVMVVVVVRS